MILLWFVLGIALAIGIARYNESNKLFWVLAIAFVMGFAGAKMVCDTIHSNKKSNCSLTQVLPTQGCVNAAVYSLTAIDATSEVTAPNLVSKVYTPALCEFDITLGEIYGRTRDQPTTSLSKPPNPYIEVKPYDTS